MSITENTILEEVPILNENIFFSNSQPIDVEFDTHSNKYSLFKCICQKCINSKIRLEKKCNMREISQKNILLSSIHLQKFVC